MGWKARSSPKRFTLFIWVPQKFCFAVKSQTIDPLAFKAGLVNGYRGGPIYLTYHSSLAGTKHTRKHHSFFLVLKSKNKLAYFPSSSNLAILFILFIFLKLTWYPSALWMYQQADLSAYSSPLDSCPCTALFLPEQKRTTSCKVYITLGVEPERIQKYNIMLRLRVMHKAILCTAAPTPSWEGEGAAVHRITQSK